MNDFVYKMNNSEFTFLALYEGHINNVSDNWWKWDVEFLREISRYIWN